MRYINFINFRFTYLLTYLLTYFGDQTTQSHPRASTSSSRPTSEITWSQNIPNGRVGTISHGTCTTIGQETRAHE